MKSKITTGLALIALALSSLVAAPAQAGSAPIRINPDGRQVQASAPLKATGKSALPKGHPVPGRAAAKTVGAYSYAGGYQYVTANGAAAKVQVTNPFVAPAPAPISHSLVEVAVQSEDGTDTIEVGFRKGQSDPGPWLFVGHWVDGVWQGYNTGFVPDPAAQHVPGQWLTASPSYPGTPVLWRIGIRHFDGVWWVGMGTTADPATLEWIGYFPDSLWGGTFTQMKLGQVFGEIYGAPTTTTDMGTGHYGRNATAPYTTNLSAAQVNSWGLYDAGGVGASLICQDTDVSLYRSSVGPTQTGYRSFFYGGPGAGGNIGS